MIAQAEVATIVASLAAVIATLVGGLIWLAKFLAVKLFGKDGNGSGGAVGGFLLELRALRRAMHESTKNIERQLDLARAERKAMLEHLEAQTRLLERLAHPMVTRKESET